MERKGINAYLLFAATMVAVSLAALFIQLWGLMLCIMNLLVLVVETLVLRFSRPEMLKRKIPMGSWWERFMTPLIALCAVAAAALSAYDAVYAHVSVLPLWCLVIGLVLLMSAYTVLAQTLKSNAPHAAEKYYETPVNDADRGPYDVIRHPVMLAVLLAGASIPLLMGSGIGFIPVGVMSVAIIVRLAAEDNWRFNNYEWFYDYTKEVSYRLIPFIW
jgi:protein-S-isoprenylcysteine O-methyltransferase Ste14